MQAPTSDALLGTDLNVVLSHPCQLSHLVQCYCRVLRDQPWLLDPCQVESRRSLFSWYLAGYSFRGTLPDTLFVVPYSFMLVLKQQANENQLVLQ